MGALKLKTKRVYTTDRRAGASKPPAGLRAARGDGIANLRLRARRAAGSFGRLDFPRDPNDEYETPDPAVGRLLESETLAGGCWDSSCGRGNILRVLRRSLPAHQRVVGSDVRQTDIAPSLRKLCSVTFGLDFLTTRAMPSGCGNIVINPPFKSCDKHIRHALNVLPHDGKLAVLLRFNWVCAKKRTDLLPWLRKIIIVGRLKMLPPGVPDRGYSGSVDFAWFVFAKKRTAGKIIIVRA